MRKTSLVLTLAVIAALLLWRILAGDTPRTPVVLAPLGIVVPVAVAIAVAAPAPASSVALAQSHGPNEIEICGLGWLDRQARNTVDTAGPLALRNAEHARIDLVDRLLADPDEVVQATGALTRAYADLDNVQRARESNGIGDCPIGECGEIDAAREALRASVDRLARQAMTTTDPRLFDLAFKACGLHSRATGACADLSTRQWARIDPDNAAPWLYILDDAAARHDAAGIDDALYHIASAKRHDDRYFALAGAIASHAGDDDSATLAAYSLVVQAMGIAAAQSRPLLSLSDVCRGKAIDDGNRRQVCQGVAETLASRSDTMLMTSIGTSMGSRLGLPAAKIDALRGLQAARIESLVPPADASNGVRTSCDGMHTELQHVLRLSQIGEMAEAREWLTASGHSLEFYQKKAHDTRPDHAAENGSRPR